MIDQPALHDRSGLQELAMKFGRNALRAGLPFQEALQLLQTSTSASIDTIEPDVLGWIVQGFASRDGAGGERDDARPVGTLASQVLRLTALHHINRAASGSLQLDKMLSTVVKVVAEATGSDACSVFLYDSYSDTLMLRATQGLNPGAVGRVVIRTKTGITGLAASTRKTQIAEDSRSHPAYITFPIVGEDAFASQVSVPIFARERDRLIGVLNIQTISPRTFAQDEVDFLESAASELAVAIENARLYSQTDAALRQRIHELNVLQSVTRSIASTLNIRDLLPLVAEFAAELLEGEHAAIFEYVESDGSIQLLSSFDRQGTGSTVDFPDSFVRMICDTRSAMESPPTQDASPDRLVLGAPLMTSRSLQGAICVTAPKTAGARESRLSLLQSFADSAAMAVENAELYEEARTGYATTSTLLQEMHHRVRNNLQTVAALLSMQARHAAYQEWTQPLQEAVARVQSIATIHDLLSSGSLTSATIEAIANKVTDEASINVVPPALMLRFNVVPNRVEIRSRQATIFALLLNEVLTNAIVHGMRGREAGVITIEAESDGHMIEVRVDDDGVGLPEEFDISAQDGLGLRIISTLATSDLKGGFDLTRRREGGTRAIIRFPAESGPAS